MFSPKSIFSAYNIYDLVVICNSFGATTFDDISNLLDIKKTSTNFKFKILCPKGSEENFPAKSPLKSFTHLESIGVDFSNPAIIKILKEGELIAKTTSISLPGNDRKIKFISPELASGRVCKLEESGYFVTNNLGQLIITNAPSISPKVDGHENGIPSGKRPSPC